MQALSEREQSLTLARNLRPPTVAVNNHNSELRHAFAADCLEFETEAGDNG